MRGWLLAAVAMVACTACSSGFELLQGNVDVPERSCEGEALVGVTDVGLATFISAYSSESVRSDLHATVGFDAEAGSPTFRLTCLDGHVDDFELDGHLFEGFRVVNAGPMSGDLHDEEVITLGHGDAVPVAEVTQNGQQMSGALTPIRPTVGAIDLDTRELNLTFALHSETAEIHLGLLMTF
jgi:hypothetical protein